MELELINIFKKLFKIGKFNPKNYGYFGDSVGISLNTIISNPRNVYLYGNNGLKHAVVLSGRGRVIFKKNSGASYGLKISTGNHARVVGIPYRCISESDKPDGFDGDVVIEEDVWIGMNVIITCGVTIGRGANIGAGSVVRNNIPPYSVVIGNPAKVVGFTFNPSQIIEHERILYPESERIPREILEKNYNDFYGIVSSNPTTHNGHFTIEAYNLTFAETFNISNQSLETLEYKQCEGWDSVGHMSLIAAIEQKFGVSLKPEDFLNFHSYNNGIKILGKYGITFEDSKKVEYPKDFFDFSSYADTVAVQTKDKKFTYSVLDNKAKEIAHLLKPNRIAFLLARNTIGSIACYCGCIKNKVPVAILDARKDVNFICNIIKQYHPEYLILPTNDVKKYEGDDLGIIFDYTIKHIENTAYPVNEQLSLMLTTSGSTGSPKFVRLTTDNIKSNAESIAEYLELTSSERPITSLPMYYSYGISIINSHFVVGATLILTEESVVSPAFWELAKEQHATSVSGVPYTYDIFMQMRVMDMDIPSLKTFTQAGGKMSKEKISFFAEKCKEKNRKFIVMYGQTEASPRISYLPFEKAVEKSESIGIAIPGVELELSDDGELIVRDQMFIKATPSHLKILKKEMSIMASYLQEIWQEKMKMDISISQDEKKDS